MPRYRITNRVTKQVTEVEAPFAQDACDALGWPIGECHVRVVREGPYSDVSRRADLRTHANINDMSRRTA